MAVNWTVMKGATPENLAIPVPPLHTEITLAGGIPWTGTNPVSAVNWTIIVGAPPVYLAIPVPQLFWRLLPVPHLFPCSSIDWTTVFCIETNRPTNKQTNQQTDQPTNRPKTRLLELLRAAKKVSQFVFLLLTIIFFSLSQLSLLSLL